MKSGAEKEKMPRQAGPAPVELDDKDRAILRLLQQNAKMTVREIAERVHLSTTPVHERIKRLEDTGVISSYIALLDYGRIARQLTVICYVSLKEHNKTAGHSFIEAMQTMEEVTECYNISGEFDFMLKVVVGTMDDYYNFHVHKLSQIENMGHVQSVFVMGVIKHTQAVI